MRILNYFQQLLKSHRVRDEDNNLVLKARFQSDINKNKYFEYIIKGDESFESYIPILGKYERRDKYRYYLGFKVESYDIIEDVVYGYILFSDGTSSSGKCLISRRVLEAFFKKIDKE